MAWGLLIVLVIGMSSSACVVPIPAEFAQELDGDGGVNAYPVIKDTNPAMPGPIQVNVNTPQPISFTLSDSDIGDTLYIRIFIDYAAGSHPGFFGSFPVTNDTSNGREDRQPKVLDTQGWCNGLTGTGTHVFDVVVADRPFDDSPNTPLPFRTPSGIGKTSTRSWLVQCVTQ